MYDSLPSYDVACNPPQWFHLHTNGSQEILNASNVVSTKHTIEDNTLLLNLTNVNVADGGAYGCYQPTVDRVSTAFCLHVHSKY